MLHILALAGAAALPPQSEVDFDRDVRPILAQHCFACHGPDAAARKADLRLDTREGATRDLGGYAAVRPGDAAASELWRRVSSTSADERMPPADAHRGPLAPSELATLRAWIEGGAAWSRHWAFVPPTRPGLSERDAHPVDDLLRQKLRAQGLAMAPRAPVHSLARRLSLDLTGLPPTPGDLRTLGPDPSDAAWLGWIDRLLASPAHAERMAMWWLDGARYADTDGFQQDATRSNWPWRDWVVDAFATNMPFDRFTQLQFAGDLLEGASAEEILATCFHRNHMHNGEGGRDPEESRVDYVRDRANTVGTVWLGLTLECAQCHDHKFDPISQADYYSLSAYFDSIDETGQAGGGARPFLAYKSPRAQPAADLAERELRAARAAENALRAAHRARFDAWLAARARAIDSHPVGWIAPTVTAAHSEDGGVLLATEGGVVVRSGPPTPKDEYVIALRPQSVARITGLELELQADQHGRFSDAADGEFILTGVKVSVAPGAGGALHHRDSPRHGRWRAAVASAEGKGSDQEVRSVRDALNDDPRNGWTTRGQTLATPPRAIFALEQPLAVGPADQVEVRLLFRSNIEGAYARRVRLRLTDEAGDATRGLQATPQTALRAALRAGSALDDLDSALRDRLLEQYLDDVPEWRAARLRTRRLDAQLARAQAALGDVDVTVLRERSTPRVTHVLLRGEWDQHGPQVAPRPPAGVWTPDPPEQPQDPVAPRLALAQWITHRDNPLTARVIVNQLWQLLFGQGLVRTPADFGIQGERPLHADVLDWLSVEFVESGWDVRHILRTIVTSEAYRQSSDATAQQRRVDPDNRWLARGARFRLPSWMIRDSALAVSGLLDRSIGGPPVFPHQPPGVWEEMFMGRMRYQPTVGQSRHRRSLYAFWRRNVTPTFFFDSTDRRTCSVDVRQTNTPLQALTVLNDRTFVAAARALALATPAPTDTDPAVAQIEAMAARVLLRPLSDVERDALTEVHAAALALYRRDPDLAATAIAPPALDVVPIEAEGDPVELAALMAVATVLLNLDETLTREEP